jgi:ABC-2 type transport system permease protein
MSWTRIRAILRKEFKDYRRNRSIFSAMAFTPVLFLAVSLVIVLRLPASVAASAVGLPLLYLLLIPVIIPSQTAAYSVIGEREQGTLEPVLTTPIRREEFLFAKALAAFIPTIAIIYIMLAVFAAVVTIADPHKAAIVVRSQEFVVVLVFSPLLAGWSILAATAISTRTQDVRTAQGFASVAGLLPAAIIALVSFGVIPRTLRAWMIIGAILLAANGWGYRRVLPALFDRERLVTGSKS